MSFLDDIVKIKYSNLGYLPGTPYHLISREEMCNAFMGTDLDFFSQTYPNVNDSLSEQYETLVGEIQKYLSAYIQDEDNVPPNWVYSYMLGEVIGPYSDVRDRHDMFVLMGLDNRDDVFTSEISQKCYEISSLWVAKYPSSEKRPATMFGEPHVIKSLRLQQLSI